MLKREKWAEISAQAEKNTNWEQPLIDSRRTKSLVSILGLKAQLSRSSKFGTQNLPIRSWSTITLCQITTPLPTPQTQIPTNNLGKSNLKIVSVFLRRYCYHINIERRKPNHGKSAIRFWRNFYLNSILL